MSMQTQKFPGQFQSKMIFIWLLVSVVVVVLDMWTKNIATAALTLYRPVELTSWLNMTLAHNYGAAFSFLSDAGGWQRWLFTGLALVVTGVLILWLLRLAPSEKLIGAALALIIGGAIGNLIDRVKHGYVVDFIDVYFRDWHWPAFNLADSAITCGVILLLVDGLFLSVSKKPSVDN
ncbi:MAG: signal peptidase II [Lysobacterales bacterium]